jgi:hypothetical protein
VLELDGGNATVSEGATTTYTACKTGGAEPPAGK